MSNCNWVIWFSNCFCFIFLLSLLLFYLIIACSFFSWISFNSWSWWKDEARFWPSLSWDEAFYFVFSKKFFMMIASSSSLCWDWPNDFFNFSKFSYVLIFKLFAVSCSISYIPLGSCGCWLFALFYFVNLFSIYWSPGS